MASSWSVRWLAHSARATPWLPFRLGATVTPVTGNHIIVGSGSVTTYNMMQAMDTLFNDATGCTITVTVLFASSPETFACQNSAKTLLHGATENPTNDVAVEEPGLGSSTGIAQLENQGSAAQPTAAVNYARSSRAIKSWQRPRRVELRRLCRRTASRGSHFTKVKNKAHPVQLHLEPHADRS